MRIATLNIRHGGARGRVGGIVAYIDSIVGDVVVLTEFRANDRSEAFVSELASKGFRHFAAASAEPKQNSVAVFSREAFTSTLYPGLGDDAQRVIKARFEGFELYGVYFPLEKAKANLFRFFLDGAYGPGHRSVFIIGDFNTGLHYIDETKATFHCSDLFAGMGAADLKDSWRSRNPDAREFSWYSSAGNGFRLDHLFSSSEADSRITAVYYDHHPRTAKLTDHSALIAEIS